MQDFDPSLAGQAAITMALARYVVFPVVSLRRRKLGDVDEPTGTFYLPKPLQKAAAFGLIALGNGLGGVLTGQQPFAAVSAGIVGAAAAMVMFDMQKKRSAEQ
jgi:hypothetical protein